MRWLSFARPLFGVLLILTSGFEERPVAQTPAASCERLAAQSLPDTTISLPQAVTAGSFTPPGSTNAMTGLPPFCRVAGVIAPTSESHILFEVWMPLEKWNGKFAGVGNGGWAGTISFGALGDQLRRGYADGVDQYRPRGGAGVEHGPVRATRSRNNSSTSRTARITRRRSGPRAWCEAFYGKPAERAYFIGCSSGGYEGLMAAQRFPSDYDGIVAGAPANNWTRLMAGDFDGVLAVLKDPASHLPPPALGLLHRAALAACDSGDGVVDGVIDDPRRCRFDPGTLACAGDQPSATCLTKPQVEAARRVYRGLTDPKTGAQLYPGLAPGSEPFWPHRDPRQSIRRSRSRTTSGWSSPIRIGTGDRSISPMPKTTRRT